MKFISFLLSFLIYLHSYGNMASPYKQGTITASAICSSNIDVLSERLNIILSKNLDSTYYEVQYNVYVDTAGKQIPLLFVAHNYAGYFKVTVDGKSTNVTNATFITDSQIIATFDPAIQPDRSVKIQWDAVNASYYKLNDLVYFEADLTTGLHQISVTYTAVAWVHHQKWIKQYEHKYSLSPAKYWRSFKTLEINLIANAPPGTITTNLPPPAGGGIDGAAYWTFNTLPDDYVEVTYTPVVSTTAQRLINISPSGLALMALVLMTTFHIYLLRRCRTKTLLWTYRHVLIAGGITVPFFALFIHFLSYGFIGYVIGASASNYPGYVGLIFLLYPVLVPPYLLLSWGIEKISALVLGRPS